MGRRFNGENSAEGFDAIAHADNAQMTSASPRHTRFLGWNTRSRILDLHLQQAFGVRGAECLAFSSGVDISIVQCFLSEAVNTDFMCYRYVVWKPIKLQVDSRLRSLFVPLNKQYQRIVQSQVIDFGNRQTKLYFPHFV